MTYDDWLHGRLGRRDSSVESDPLTWGRTAFDAGVRAGLERALKLIEPEVNWCECTGALEAELQRTATETETMGEPTERT